MTPDFKPGSPEEMESRITALLLGELPEAEAAEVRRDEVGLGLRDRPGR